MKDLLVNRTDFPADRCLAGHATSMGSDALRSPALWTVLDRIELAWPQEPHDLIDALRGGVNSKPKGNAIAQYENGCLSVCLDPVKRHALPTPFGESGNESCYVLATRNRDSRCVHKSSAICVRNNILCEESFQSSHICVLRGGDKGLQQAPLLARSDGR